MCKNVHLISEITLKELTQKPYKGILCLPEDRRHGLTGIAHYFIAFLSTGNNIIDQKSKDFIFLSKEINYLISA